VTNLVRSIAFYRAYFGLDPAKQYADYAKFEVEEPPLIFSITPHPSGPAGGPLGHAGFKVSSPEAIENIRLRLEAAGYPVQCQKGAVCGYRRQDKLHVADPDVAQWEVYIVEEELAPQDVQRSVEGDAARVEIQEGPLAWEHFVTNPMPDRIPHDDATLDEVRLVGTFNASLADEQQRFLVHEARRVLKPNGKVMVHGLMADRPFPGAIPTLPGLAAMVSRVPVQTFPLEMLREAGFVGLQITRYSEKAWFQHDGVELRAHPALLHLGLRPRPRDGVELREVKLPGWQPSAAADRRRVVYKGPFVETIDDAGTVYPRGRRVEVSAATWDLLRRGPAAANFLFLDLPGGEANSCG
jgi:catechol 2,3-dioxygenase-like lactoylglutathione lyase family enzyme